MERRLLLAVSLMIAILVVPSFFLKRPVPPRVMPDSTASPTAPISAGPDTIAVRTPAARRPQVAAANAPVTEPVGDTISVAMADAAYRFNTRGAALEQATLANYKSFNAGGGQRPVELIRARSTMLAQRLVVGSDTISLDGVTFSAVRNSTGITMTGPLGALTEIMTVTPAPGQRYLLDVRGEIAGLEGRGGLLLVSLGDGFANVEADSADNYRNFAAVVRQTTPENTDFRSVDTGAVRTLPGPFDWVAVKSKYFIGALLSADSSRPQFGGAVLIGAARDNRTATRLHSWVTMTVGPDGRFHYQLYLGPQTRQTLRPLGRQLDRASSYGWIFKPIVMPAVGLIARLFIWMHENLRLSYGLALVVFGVLVRLVLWPLNQRAMKSQVAMMAVQPVLKDIQTRYKNDPAKLQQEMMKVYKEHNVNPLGGCLPLLIPMPVLLALFFVFSRAIELRGTAFLWLPDLSLRDPFYITPLVMGLSMFALSKLSQAGMPPNPQAKMMTTVMPVMMTVMFANFASGLNMYYAVSNLVSLPQQYLINKSRLAEMSRRQIIGTDKKGR